MAATFHLQSDLIYARLEQHDLKLDLYLPDSAPRPLPTILWIHGGAWRMGDQSDCAEILPLLQEGYAIASIEYRLSQEAIFPAQIRDVKAATRWLRAHAPEYGLDPDRFASAGSSAGGHLATLMGSSFYYRIWDQPVEYLECAPQEVSSAVQAVVDWFGPTDFLKMNDKPGVLDHFAPDSPESQLLGGPVLENPERTAAANPISYLYPGFPAFLILHGDRDQTVLPEQSVLLHQHLQKKWCHSELVFIEGAGHGFEGEHHQKAIELVNDFLQRELREPALPRSAYYACTMHTFRPRTRHAVRWLNPYEDYELARVYWGQVNSELSPETWQEAYQLGYSYAAVIDNDHIISIAAVLRYSDYAWELAAVSTDPTYRQQGYSKSVCSFVTKYILGTGRIATVSTAIQNTAMQKTAESIGFQRV